MKSMAKLRVELTDLGLRNVKTVLATGNAICEADEEGASVLESMLERQILARLKFQTDFLVRSSDELGRWLQQTRFQRMPVSAPVNWLSHSATPLLPSTCRRS